MPPNPDAHITNRIYWELQYVLDERDVDPEVYDHDMREHERPIWATAVTFSDALAGVAPVGLWAYRRGSELERIYTVHALTDSALLSATVTVTASQESSADAAMPEHVVVQKRRLVDVARFEVVSSSRVVSLGMRGGTGFANRTLQLVFEDGFVAEFDETERDRRDERNGIAALLEHLAPCGF